MSELRSKMNVQEGILYPIPYHERNIWGKLKPIILTLCAILLLLSFLFQENMLMQLQWFPRFMIIIMFIRVIVVDVDRWGPSDMEILLFDDHLEIFRNKVFRSKKHIRQEWECMYYKDVKECKYRKQSKQIEIIGRVCTQCREYDQYGRLQEQLSHNKTTDSFAGFYTQFMNVEAVIAEIEKNTPLKVEERMS